MSEHIEVKHKLQQIPSVSDFRVLLDACMLSDEDKQIMDMIYRQNKTISYIADVLGYHEATVKRRHKQILKKLRKLI